MVFKVPVLLFFHLFKLTSLCNEQKHLFAVKLVFVILLLNNHGSYNSDIFCFQCFLQSRLFLLAQFSIMTATIGPIMLRAPLVLLIKTLIAIYSYFSPTVSNILRPKRHLKSIEWFYIPEVTIPKVL